MDSGFASLSPQTLLEHEPFVRAVARGLLGDAGEAEDVAQETWMRTLAEGPRERGALRAWLGRVAANLAHDRRRSATRQALREERVARAEAQESVAVGFERLSIQRDVVAAILELDEPYRGVVLLRYFHELEPQAIAARLGTKPATVRTQLVRAHELLRAKLDSRYGRETWAALLLPTGVTVPGSRLGGLPALALAGGVLAAGAAIWALWSGSREPSHAPALATAPVGEPPSETAAPALQVSATRSVVSAAPDTTRPAADPRAVKETLAPRAELLARSKYDDYEKATFSFELGLRDDPEQIVGNDWDVLYEGRRFRATTIVDDTSQLVDLGDLRIGDLWDWRGELTGASEYQPVVQGHTYFHWSRDSDTDLTVAFEVLELLPEDRCTLEWYATADGRTARASFHDTSPGMQLAARLIALRSELRRPGELRVPRVLLQARNGAGGGNPHRVDIAGELGYFDERSVARLDPFAPIEENERGVAYCDGGCVPEGAVFVVTRATYWGTARGDSNGQGGFALVIGGQRVAENEHEQPLSGTWVGQIEIPPGAEMLTYLELKNSSAGEAELFGEFVERPGLLARAPRSKSRTPRPPKPKPAPLSEPYARLQGRNGAGGGNKFRVKLDGDLDRFRELATAPIDLLAPIDTGERGMAYCEGGVVPEGQVFVVTRVDYWGVAMGDSNGPGGFAVVIGGERIVEHEDAEPLTGTWYGRIEIPALLERSTFLELRNSSAGEAILRGTFVPAR